MSIEGQLAITLRRDLRGPPRAEIKSTRPTALARRFAGRKVHQVVRELPLLFSVCGTAQASATVTACARALDLEEPATTELARRLLVKAEILREHLLRMIQGSCRNEGTAWLNPLQVMQIVPELRAALSPEEDPFSLGAAPGIDANKARDAIAGIESLLRELVFGMTPGEWLARSEPAEFEGWAFGSNTAPGRLVAQVLRAGWAGSGASDSAFLPELPEAALLDRLTSPEGKDFAARPAWEGRHYETTSLGRQGNQPLVAALLEAYGNGLATRLAARLVEVARLPGEMRELLVEGATEGDRDEPLGGGRGLAQIEAARGRLIHGVLVEGDLVSDYCILAPTEWNFHAQGGVARALAELDESDEDGLREQAALLIEAVDPCVGYELVLQ